MTAKYVTCRVLNGKGNQCTAEAVSEDAELKICVRHLAEAKRLWDEALASRAGAGVRQSRV